MGSFVTGRLGVILGTSRSGTTWLGAIVGSHPEVAYRFEPIRRLSQRGSPARDIVSDLHESRDPQADVDRLRRALLTADPSVDKPPFFPKSYRTRCARGKGLLWPAARASAPVARLFRWLYTPLDDPPVIYKEVNQERWLGGLLSAGVPVVYLLRHPCGVVWSHLRGQARGQMKDAREHLLPEILSKQNGALAEKYGSMVDDLTKAQRRALLWRVSVDTALAHAEHPLLHTVVYESLCRDPEHEVRRAFEHLGLEWSSQIEAFLAESASPSRRGAVRRGDLLSSRYFTVFRDPRAGAEKWRRQMPEADQQGVMKIVADSPGFALGVERGEWAPAGEANKAAEAGSV